MQSAKEFEALGIVCRYDAANDQFVPVTQADWDEAAAFIAQFGKMTTALREFHAVLEAARLSSFPRATPRPIPVDEKTIRDHFLSFNVDPGARQRVQRAAGIKYLTTMFGSSPLRSVPSPVPAGIRFVAVDLPVSDIAVPWMRVCEHFALHAPGRPIHGAPWWIRDLGDRLVIHVALSSTEEVAEVLRNYPCPWPAETA